MTNLQPVTAAPSQTTSKRMRSLDGLRGLAALTVVLGHTRLAVLQNFDSQLFQLPGIRHALDLLGILGAHSVWLFFVLSGLVLSRMLMATKDFDYGNYILGRLARLYIPVWAAVAFTFVTMILVPRGADGLGTWVDAHPDSYAPWAIINDLTLIGGASSNLSPLWSLRWEVLFSVLLILYTAVMRKMPPVLGVALSIVLCVIGQYTGNQVLMFMSMFAIGTALAIAWDSLAGFFERFETRMRPMRALYAIAAVTAVALTIVLQLLPNLLAPLQLSAPVIGVVSMGSTMGALTASIILVGLSTPLRTIFETRIMQWLGLISFSLYLIHEPVLLVFVYLTNADPVAIFVGLALCFPIAQLFYWAIEKPSHRFARRFSRSKAAPMLVRDQAIATETPREPAAPELPPADARTTTEP